MEFLTLKELREQERYLDRWSRIERIVQNILGDTAQVKDYNKTDVRIEAPKMTIEYSHKARMIQVAGFGEYPRTGEMIDVLVDLESALINLFLLFELEDGQQGGELND